MEGGIKGFSLSPLVPVTEMHRQRESPPTPSFPHAGTCICMKAVHLSVSGSNHINR